ncbi:MAG: hypothetical protein MJ009_02805 [Paludibacteraceae bacterium]|nr:hypothetical protein [Paludibacteraceae bacterium]
MEDEYFIIKKVKKDPGPQIGCGTIIIFIIALAITHTIDSPNTSPIITTTEQTPNVTDTVNSTVALTNKVTAIDEENQRNEEHIKTEPTENSIIQEVKNADSISNKIKPYDNKKLSRKERLKLKIEKRKTKRRKHKEKKI